MRKGLWRRKSAAVIAGVLCAVLGAGALLPGKLAYTKADEGTVHYDLSKEALSGEESELLLANPDRGLRMEAYLNVGTGMSEFEYEDMDGIEQLRQQVERYARRLCEMGARNVIVSLGSSGAMMINEAGEEMSVPAFIGDAVDTVGAGDALVAAFVAAKEKGRTDLEALRRGVAAGCATAFKEGLAERTEIDALLRHA